MKAVDTTSPNYKNGSPYGKITEDVVRDIRAMFKQGIKQRVIAAKHNLDPSVVSRICNGYYWKWVK